MRWLTRSETVRLLVQDKKAKRRAAHCLRMAGADLDRVEFIKAPTDRCWMRDSGPMVVADEAGQPLMLDWKFNAWAKYDNYADDDKVPKRAAERLGMRRRRPMVEVEGVSRRFVLEGGAIDVNGQGALLTTEECLLSPIQARNPGLGQNEIEAVFERWLGAKTVIWLGRGIVGDDTHGHIDDLARFVDPKTIAIAIENDPEDENYGASQENLVRLQHARDQNGDPFRIVELPMPRPVICDGVRLPASYANFYIADSVVLVPTFNDPADRRALAAIADLFPNREVVGIHAVDLVWGLGTLHCLAKDQPKINESAS